MLDLIVYTVSMWTILFEDTVSERNILFVYNGCLVMETLICKGELTLTYGPGTRRSLALFLLKPSAQGQIINCRLRNHIYIYEVVFFEKLVTRRWHSDYADQPGKLFNKIGGYLATVMFMQFKLYRDLALYTQTFFCFNTLYTLLAAYC